MRCTFLYILLFLPFIYPAKVYAERPAYQIGIEAPQLEGKSVYFCQYFNGNVYKQDSILISRKKGKQAFAGKEKLPEGLYSLYFSLDGGKMYDFIVSDEQHFTIRIDTLDFPERNTIQGSAQTEAFQKYSRYLAETTSIQQAILEKAKSVPEEQLDPYRQQLKELDGEVKRYTAGLLKLHQGQWVAAFLAGLQEVTGPYPDPVTREEYREETDYVKSHYFDYIDLQDRRFWYTNYFPRKVDEYFDKVVVRHPDSLALAASRLVARTEGDSLCFRLMLSKLFDTAATSKLMAMENTWAKLAEEYCFSGKAYWLDSLTVDKLKAEYAKIRYNRIGMQAYDLILTDPEGQTVQLNSVAGNYTLLCFYDTGCGHCSNLLTKIKKDIYPVFHPLGLEVVCMNTQTNEADWKSFIDRYQLNEWINLWDPNRTSLYWQYYDASSVPMLYLLDKDKTILAKKMDAEGLKLMLESLLKP